MFSLIITIISIALVAALAVATIYYGGSAFTQGTAKANASAFVAAGQQVNGALVLFANDKAARAADINALVTNSYLAAAPSVGGKALTVETASVQALLVPAAVCTAINATAGVTVQPTTAAAALALAAPYSCAADFTFVFKG